MEHTKNQQLPKLLVVTGPQGSGNHLLAKIFNLHPKVNGWNMRWQEWQGHHLEPFQEYWQDPKKLKHFKPGACKNFVTSISCPYVKNKKSHIPKYKQFISEAKKYFTVKILVISRDRNILEQQQKRVRGKPSTLHFIDQLKFLKEAYFVSHEALYLYGSIYLQSLSKQIDFPIAYNNPTLLKDLFKIDANKKYIQKVKQGKFDKEVKKACKES